MCCEYCPEAQNCEEYLEGPENCCIRCPEYEDCPIRLNIDYSEPPEEDIYFGEDEI